VEDSIKKRITEKGLPTREDGEMGWQTQADVVRFIHNLLADRKELASDSTVKKHVREILGRLKDQNG
jgi:hypothetical protein